MTGELKPIPYTIDNWPLAPLRSKRLQLTRSRITTPKNPRGFLGAPLLAEALLSWFRDESSDIGVQISIWTQGSSSRKKARIHTQLTLDIPEREDESQSDWERDMDDLLALTQSRSGEWTTHNKMPESWAQGVLLEKSKWAGSPSVHLSEHLSELLLLLERRPHATAIVRNLKFSWESKRTRKGTQSGRSLKSRTTILSNSNIGPLLKQRTFRVMAGHSPMFGAEEGGVTPGNFFRGSWRKTTQKETDAISNGPLSSFGFGPDIQDRVSIKEIRKALGQPGKQADDEIPF